jgi:hypothetical protein
MLFMRALGRGFDCSCFEYKPEWRRGYGVLPARQGRPRHSVRAGLGCLVPNRNLNLLQTTIAIKNKIKSLSVNSVV